MQSKVTDEMIVRYLSGKATPDEESAVLDHLAESDEHLDDLLAMSAAVEQYNEGKTKHHVRSLWPTISVAATVALLFGVGITLWHHNTGTNISSDPAPAYAEQDSIEQSELISSPY